MGVGELVAPPFFLNDKTLAPDVFSSCSFIPCAHFEKGLLVDSYYDYENDVIRSS